MGWVEKHIRLYVLLVPVLLCGNPVYAEDKVKIAVAAEQRILPSDVSRMAARSPHFLVFDGNGKLLDAVDNPYKEAGRRTGSLVAEFLAREGVHLIVAGQFGEKMIQALEREGVRHLEFRGGVEEAVNNIVGCEN